MDDIKGILIWAVFLAIVGGIWFFTRRIKKQIEENGIETTGTVSRIVDEGTEDIDIRYYVRYRTEDGEEIEGVLSNSRSDLAEGQQVRIKYHPKYKANARLTDPSAHAGTTADPSRKN